MRIEEYRQKKRKVEERMTKRRKLEDYWKMMSLLKRTYTPEKGEDRLKRRREMKRIYEEWVAKDKVAQIEEVKARREQVMNSDDEIAEAREGEDQEDDVERMEEEKS